MQNIAQRVGEIDTSLPLCHVIKLEESQYQQHGENKAKKGSQIWQHVEINRAKNKERKTQGNSTCQREKNKQVEATDVQKEEETSKKKNQIEGTDVTL